MNDKEPKGSESMKKERDGVKGFIVFILTICGVVFCAHAQEVNKTDTEGGGSKEKAVFNSVIKRDPFKPFIKIFKKKEPEPEVSKSLPPIKRYPLDQFKLVGIVWVGAKPRAMVVDPEKNTYVLGIGEEIGSKNGKVVEIKNNVIIVEEKRYLGDAIGKEGVETFISILAFRE
jgi:hypothetical protein